MSIPLTAPQVLESEYLLVRAKLLEIGAALDRLDRADGSIEADPRSTQIREGLAILADDSPDKAEQIQLLFSREYEDDWQELFQMPQPK